jgi:RsiW-degrading membrane proteinase PrsW (M82 family)
MDAATLVTVFVASFAPSLVFLGYYALKDRYEPEPLRLLLGVFAGGLVAAPVALLLFELASLLDFYALLQNTANIESAPEVVKLTYTMVLIGPLEELVKFSVVFFTVYRFRVIDEPVDGLIYAAAAALGFATYENWATMLYVDDVLWAPALTLPFNHVLFSSFWGYALGVERCARGRDEGGSRLVVVGLVLSFVYHGLYNYIVLEPSVPDLLVLPLVLVLWLWVQFALRRLVERSPFRPADEAANARAGGGARSRRTGHPRPAALLAPGPGGPEPGPEREPGPVPDPPVPDPPVPDQRVK